MHNMFKTLEPGRPGAYPPLFAADEVAYFKSRACTDTNQLWKDTRGVMLINHDQYFILLKLTFLNSLNNLQTSLKVYMY